MPRGRARHAGTPSVIAWDGSEPKSKIGLAGCLGIIALIGIMYVIGVMVFTFVLNVVAHDIFGIIDQPLDLWQGAAIWVLLAIIGGAFRKAT